MAEKDISARLRRAVKENNLFLVKRLLERTADMRNADPGGTRHTSLAWAAFLGHEETFEYLLERGHDDEELSKDADNNTILIILAGLRTGVNSPFSSSRGPDILQQTALRMARLYHERFPFIHDWSNAQGKTALHMAALKGNETFVEMLCDLGADVDLADIVGNTPLHYASSWGHLSVVKLLIERGCQFAARNNDGYTATDYAYSHHTKETLEDSARDAHDARKNARRPFVQSRALSLDEDRPLPPRKEFKRRAARLRSGSGTTTTSDSADEIIAQANSQSSLSSITSSQTSGFSTNAPLSALTHGFSSSPRNLSQGTLNGMDSLRSAHLANTSLGLPATGHSALSPIASRVLANDAGAMAEYLKRNRSGSQGESNRHVIVQASSSTINTATPPIMEEPISQKYPLRSLRPSLSAAALRQASSGASPTQTSPASGFDIRSRFRAGTNPSTVYRSQFSPPAPVAGRLSSEDTLDHRNPTPRRTATSGPSLPSLPEPINGRDIKVPPALPPKDHFPHRRGPSLS